MDLQLLMIVCAAGALGLGVWFVMRMLVGDGSDDKLRDRLTGTGTMAPQASNVPKAGLKDMFQKLGQAAAQPFMPKTREAQSGMKENLSRAGLYSPTAVRVLVGCKVIFLFVGLIGGYAVGVVTDKMWMALSLGGLIGYLAPQLWLKLKIRANQRELSYGLADGLDLMVVCVEAGLTVDAAMQRVGAEMGLAHPALAREFSIAHMETRVGLSRIEALRNMGQRTGCPALVSLASMLIQADRFGTSIAQALRVQAETLRLNRQFAAEEQASKASVKISFPLVLFIFPATFIVLCGLVFIDLMNSSLFK
jgi:tight adherence protein C